MPNMCEAYPSTERASVLGMLGYFDLLYLFTKGSTIASTVLSDNAYFLCSSGLTEMMRQNRMHTHDTTKQGQKLLLSSQTMDENTCGTMYMHIFERCHLQYHLW